MCYVAMAAMFVLMCMTTIDTILRKTAVGGITDSFDITELFMVLIIFCGFAFLESDKGHVRVDVFLNMFPKTSKRVVDSIMYLLSAGTLVMIAVAMFRYIFARYANGAATQILGIPHWPFVIIVTIALILFALTTFLHALDIALGGGRKAA